MRPGFPYIEDYAHTPLLEKDMLTYATAGEFPRHVAGRLNGGFAA